MIVLEVITIISIILNIVMATTTTVSEAIGLSKCKNNTIIETIVPQLSREIKEEKKEEKK